MTAVRTRIANPQPRGKQRGGKIRPGARRHCRGRVIAAQRLFTNSVQRAARARRTPMSHMRGHTILKARFVQKPSFALRAHHFAQPAPVDHDLMTLHKHQRVQYLIESRWRVLSPHRAMAREYHNSTGPHRFAMALSANQDQAPDPAHRVPCGEQTAVFRADNSPHPVRRIRRHWKISSQFNCMKADLECLADRESDRHGVRKMKNNPRNRRLCSGMNIRNIVHNQTFAASKLRRGELNKQTVALLAKNTFRNRLYSWAGG